MMFIDFKSESDDIPLTPEEQSDPLLTPIELWPAQYEERDHWIIITDQKEEWTGPLLADGIVWLEERRHNIRHANIYRRKEGDLK